MQSIPSNNQSLSQVTISKGRSEVSILPFPKNRYFEENQNLKKIATKLNSISQSIDFKSLRRNPLNLIEYEMESEKSIHDPQMVLAKLRKVQNRAEIHRADLQLAQIEQDKKNRQRNRKIPYQHHRSDSQHTRPMNISYIKIYEKYLKQKQVKALHNEHLLENEQDNKIYEEQSEETMDGIKFYSQLRKHPRLLDLTVSRRKEKEDMTQKQIKTQRKQSLSRVLREPFKNEEFFEEKCLQKTKQASKLIQNPEKVIERQITKFYLKKNPGKLTEEAKLNERSMELISKQKSIFLNIEDKKISKEDRKRLQNRFNDLVNELAKSDRKKSLEGILPKLKSAKQQTESFDEVKRKLFNNYW